MAQSNWDKGYIDIFQHLIDEIERTNKENL